MVTYNPVEKVSAPFLILFAYLSQLCFISIIIV